nr:MFS transporter [Sphingomonas sp. CDS-1]
MIESSAAIAEGRPADPIRDGLAQPKRFWAAFAIWVTLILSSLDVTIVNVALPTISNHLGVAPDEAVWVVNSYQIAITMLLFPAAALGEKFGFRRIYLSGVAIFAIASLGCTLANNLIGLVGFRFLQGVGAGAIMALNGALVRLVFPRAILGRAVGYNAMVIAISSAAGPSVAAAILGISSWRWLFAVNVPVAIGALALGLRFLPRSFRNDRAYEWGTSLLIAIVFAAFFLSAADFGHGADPRRWVFELLITMAGLILLWYLALDDHAPMFPVDLLRLRLLRLSYITSICSFSAQMMAFVTLPFILNGRNDMDHVAIGLMMTPWPLATAIAAPVAGRLVESVPASILGCGGLAATTTGLVIIAILPSYVGPLPIAAAMALAGAGFGFFQAPNNRTLIAAAPVERSGAAGSMQAMARLAGQTTGAIGAAMLFRTFSSASTAPLWIAAILSLAGAIGSQRRSGEAA